MDSRGAESEDLAIAEALRRSLVEKTREESLIADVIRESVLSHDEELARAMQAQFEYEDRHQNRSISHPIHVDGTPTYDNSLEENNRQGPWLVALTRGRSAPVKPATTNTSIVPPIVHTPQRGVQHRVPAAVTTTARTATAIPANRVPSLSQSNGTMISPTTATSPMSTNLGSPVTPSSITIQSKPTVIIDGLNIGCAFGAGGGRRFRSRGVQIALEYYRARGVYAMALIPANKVDRNLGSIALADDPQLLLRLHSQNRVAFTPTGSNDDNYLLTYAMSVNADLVSNDRYRRELGRQRGSEAAKRLKMYLKFHLVPFTFILEQFVPNPHPESLASHLHHPRDRGYR